MATVPTYDSLKLPERVSTVLITGAGGFVGKQLTELLLQHCPSVRLITTDVVEPPKFTDDANRLRVVKADLGKPDELASLFEGETINGVYALHGIMSGGSEANFQLGWSVNVDSHVALLKATHAHAEATGQTGENKKPVYVFASSLAVYGGPKCRPQDYVLPDETPLLPGTSYGVEKVVVELYVYDYGRKGYLDTRSVRLPTVCIRSGAPSTAASSCISGLIREPLSGQKSTVPIASGPDDPAMDTFFFYVTRVKTVIRNIAYALCMPEDKFIKGEGRSINLPGFKVSVRQILAALEKYGGKEALDLVDYKLDPAVVAIASTWAGDYDSSKFQDMGFEVDDLHKGYEFAVEDFVAEMKAAKQ